MKLLFNSTICALLLTSNIVFAQGSVGMLSDEELRPFCENESIWKQYSVTAEQCMEASKTCAKANAEAQLDFMAATQALYGCVFKKLGVKGQVSFGADGE
ncbi:hypothetical protein [Agarilytica rhodophyticola]|uniref:hypothetical protein n=1 Tax=Agarilytica rhodophyticola TaxID=1737490 RepID=UPI000B349F7F|nr:hypothetical protein [Agarilytica rhodophyticola]